MFSIVMTSWVYAYVPSAVYREKAAKRAIQEVYDQSNAAASRKDLDGVFRNYTFDFAGELPDHRIEKISEYRHNLTKLLTQCTSSKFVCTIKTFTLNGSAATVRVRQQASVTLKGVGTDKARRLVSDEIDQDDWVKSKDGWKFRHTKVLFLKQTLARDTSSH